MESRRLITLSISFCSLLIIIIPEIVAGNQLTVSHDICEEKRCSPNGPAVRFPFLLRGKQPEYCGYNPSFNLSCDEANVTILEFPSSTIKFDVTNIDYSSQTIQVKSPESCFAKQLRGFDESSILPFHFAPSLNYFVAYSLFTCSPSIGNVWDRIGIRISCLEIGNGYQVYAIDKVTPISRYPVESCTKMYDTNVIYPHMLDSPSVGLSWSSPVCESCETKGGICRWENGTNHRIVCLGGKNQSGISRILHIAGSVIGSLFLILAATTIYFLYSTKKLDKENGTRIRKFLEDYSAMKPTRYSYADIKKITNDFRDKLGEGGFGNVFKGMISSEIFVAVKLLHDSTGNGEEFINEVGTMGTIHHVNVVRLLGFCADGIKRALVYEFLPNGSLDKFIFPKGQEHHTLGMARLQDIAIGIARGIEYLHQGCEQRILHFDIKPHNILLDDKHNPKISDFGLAKLCEKGRSAVSMTAARGTMGYIAPEVFSRHFGNVSYKSDIYSFGMLLLEMVGRRKNIDATVQNVSQVYFPEWVYGRLVNGAEWCIQVEEDGEDKIAKKLAIVGLWCIQWNPADRPSMTSVLQMLEASGESLSLPPNPFTSGHANNSSDPDDHGRHLASRLDVISESE